MMKSFDYCNSLILQLELKLGLGGTSYEDFIRNMHLPMQLRYVNCNLKSWTTFSCVEKVGELFLTNIIKLCTFVHCIVLYLPKKGASQNRNRRPLTSSWIWVPTSFSLLLSQVDPIVASFSGGAVGVISALMLIEANNVVQQEKKKCKYCYGSGMFMWNLLHIIAQCLHYWTLDQ